MFSLVHRAVLLVAVISNSFSMTAGTLGSLNLQGFGFVLGQGVLPSRLPLIFLISGDSGTPCWNASPSCMVLIEQDLTPADIGSVFAFGPSSPGFASVVSFLTDGIDDEWSFTTQSRGGAVGQSVSSMLPTRNWPDFAGDTITEIDLTVNDLVFRQVQLPVGINPITFGTFTEAAPNFTITVQGSEVPEPQTVLLVAAALLVGAASHRLWKLRTSQHST